MRRTDRDFVDAMRAAAPPRLAERAEALACEVLFMEGRLAETRAKMGGTELVVAYDNGGGQTGIRKNPVYDAYNALLKSYISAIDALGRIAGVEVQAAPAAQPEPDDGKVIAASVLEEFRARHRKGA